MRIVIDLQAQQHSHGSVADGALALAQALVRQAGSHDVWIALGLAWPDSVDTLRHAFAGLLPPDRIRSYDTPDIADDATRMSWPRRAAEHIRENFLLNLETDLVFSPGLFERDSGALCAPRPLPGNTLSVFGVSGLESWQRVHDGLRHADLLLTPSAAVRDGLIETCGMDPARVADVGAAPEAAATRIWALFAALVADKVAAAAPVPSGRPRLAYLSPLPPEQSGIADYSVDMIAELSRWYDIDVITDQVSVSVLPTHFSLRSVAWFEAHAQEFDRLLYHFGNNQIHRHMFALLQRHPGVVVLHDFFLSGVLDQMDLSGYRPGALNTALYHSHGYTGLVAQRRLGRNEAIWSMPCNKDVLDQAAGVIVHSEYAQQLARHWYGADAACDWRRAPLPRTPLNRRTLQRQRADARVRLGLGADDMLVCSFGMMGDTKLNEELVDAFLASTLADDARCRLVFVGQAAGTDYGAGVEAKIAASKAAGRISISGFVSAEAYADYAAATDIAVQLRRMSRGETSAAILDCLLYGAPTIVNAHGAAAELPDDILLKLEDHFDSDALAAALERLHGDAGLRAALSQRGADFVAREHAPGRTGKLYHDAIEHFAATHPRSRYHRLLRTLGHMDTQNVAGSEDLLSAARAITFNQPPTGPRQLFIDVSALCGSDLKTGIQRVVRSVVLALVNAPPPGWRVEPVYGDGGNRPYRYARRFMLGMLGIDAHELHLEDAPVDARPGDIFLGLDLFANGTSQNRHLLKDMRRRGIAVHFVVYDVLPLLHPHYFPFGTDEYFRDYLDTITQVADGVVCISRSVADELAAWLAPRTNPRDTPLQLGYFHLGADIDASKPSTGLPENAAQLFDSIAACPSVLMVGTIEPRKGHAQALAAFDLLWEKNMAVNLVIVGKEGWMIEKVAQRLKSHPQREKHLFWIENASDEMLLQLYQKCSGLLAASEGEGFGLPLIEAAQHGIPILARDLPVFREVSGEHAQYFQGSAATDLAVSLEHWVNLLRESRAPASTDLPWLSWHESATQLLGSICGQQWYRQLPAGGGAAGVAASDA